MAQTTKRCPLRCSTDTIIRPRHIRDLAVSITEDDITTSTTFDNVVRQYVFQAISHIILPYVHGSEKANLRADIQKFAMRTKSTESAHEELKLCVDRQVSAVNRHRNKQQAIVDDRKRLFLELTAAQSELDDQLELRRKLMATLLERCSQVCLFCSRSLCLALTNSSVQSSRSSGVQLFSPGSLPWSRGRMCLPAFRSGSSQLLRLRVHPARLLKPQMKPFVQYVSVLFLKMTC